MLPSLFHFISLKLKEKIPSEYYLYATLEMLCVCCDTCTHVISLCLNICIIYIYNVYIIIADLDLIDFTGKEEHWRKKIKEICENKIELHPVKEWRVSHPWLLICNAKVQGCNIDVTETIQEAPPVTLVWNFV